MFRGPGGRCSCEKQRPAADTKTAAGITDGRTAAGDITPGGAAASFVQKNSGDRPRRDSGGQVHAV